MRTIYITICDAPSDMGPAGTADDVRTFLALVEERLALLYQGASITIETSPLEGTFAADSEGEEIEVLDAIQASWEAWCVGLRAGRHAHENGTTLREVAR